MFKNFEIIFRLIYHGILGLITVASVSLISFLLFIFFKNRRLIKTTYLFLIINMIIVDMLKSLVYIPILSYSFEIIFKAILAPKLMLDTKYNKERLVVCNINSIFSMFFETLQLFNMVTISFERYRMNSALKAPKTLTKFLILISWLSSLALTVCFFSLISTLSDFRNFNDEACYMDIFFMSINILDHENVTSSSLTKEKSIMSVQNRVFDLYCIVITSCAFLLILIFYGNIFAFLKKHEKKMVDKTTNHVLKANKILPRYISLFITSILF